ncbi:hypothetical protein [Glycomyces dulcitolivorans]|uniref:hypothetical protein n=1 Tax=Glycomyces dulcitolivorans TaxID=2200759 RepID=UPI000DD4BD4D|nr:hypothetical protein [Glycomyces dulcitolivorans]
MSNPDPLAAVFTDYTDDTSAEVRDGSTDRLWRKAKRRRIGRVAVASAAALALLVPAGWLLANTAGADGPEAAEEPPPVWTAPAPEGNGPNTRSDMLVKGYETLVGAVVDLPSFIPGNDEVDEICQVDDAVVVPGWVEVPDEEGAVFLREYTSLVPAMDAAPIPVALLGCDYGDGTAFQVVTLADEGDQWSTIAQYAHTEADGAVPLEITGSDEPFGEIKVGFAERYDPEANDLDYWFETITLDAAGDPVSTPAGDLDVEGFSDLNIDLAAMATGEAGVWDFTATIRNDGPRDATGYEVYMCALWSQTFTEVGLTDCINHECVDTGDGCPSNREPVAVIDLPVGESVTYEWTVVMDLDQWQAYIDSIDDAALAGPLFEITAEKPTEDRTIPRSFTRAAMFAEFLL